MTTVTTILLIFLCILGQAFFEGSEIALISIDRLRLRHAAKTGHKPSIRVQEILKRPEWLLGTTIIGTNICVVLSTTLTTALFYDWLGQNGIFLTILIIALINWIFAEIVPKSIFQYYANLLAIRVSFILYIISIIFFPLVWIFSKSGSILASIVGGKISANLPFISKGELKLMMKVISDKSDIKISERKMIDRLLSFKELKAADVMVPLIKVVVLNENSTVREAQIIIAQSKHRRVPIYRERVDQICGILNSFDILGEDPDIPIQKFMRSAFYVPGSMEITVLLEHLQKSGNNMAIVVDEYGGAEGIVTIEDILEEVVGEIGDEYDLTVPGYQILHDASILISGQTDIREINERFQLELPEGEYETLGGFLIDRLQKIPRVGDRYKIKNAILTVTKATPSSVLEVKIKKLTA